MHAKPEHRWVRFNRLLIALRKQIEGFGFAADLDRHTLPLKVHIERSSDSAPLDGPSGDPSHLQSNPCVMNRHRNCKTF